MEALSSHLDNDTIEYISSLLEDNPECDDDVREMIFCLISGSVDDEGLAEELMQSIIPSSTSNDDQVQMDKINDDVGVTLKKLDKMMCIQDALDVNGTEERVDEFGLTSSMGGNVDKNSGTDIQDFYANMIDIRTEEVTSQRAKRKEAQRKLREQQEEEDRLRAIRDVVEMAMSVESDEKTYENGDFDDNFADVHLRNFSLPNKRGSGADLLSDSNLTLSKGRRYGLLGRNGCGKTTLLELLSQRGIPGIPRKMSMLLVRQEIIGNDLTPVEFVLQSDAKRAGLKKYIEMCEASTDSEMDGEKLALAYERLEELDEQPPEPRARKILYGLGFSDDMQAKPTRELSGGCVYYKWTRGNTFSVNLIFLL